jgi:hypothetical protein
MKNQTKQIPIGKVPEDWEYAKVKDDIKEQREFCKRGIGRIKEYYHLSEDKREEKTRLKRSPHDILMKRSVNLIFLGFESSKKDRYIEEEPIHYILIGIGTEILLKAIILKEDPEYFIENIKGDKTLSFNQCKEKLIDLLPENFALKQVRRVKDVLELIKQKRNNLVHLGFHQMEIYREDYQIVNVLEFLFSYFFREDAKEIIKKLKELKEKEKITSGIDYGHIEFSNYET